MNSHERRLPVHHNHQVCFTLDVLSDGSECTGRGTLFLSAWKQTTNPSPSWLQEAMEIGSPLCRYAISGIGDLTSRLAADQRLKLAPTQAVFAPTPDSLDGLSALLLALRSAGAASLHVASTSADIIDELMEIVLGNRCNFQVSNCEIPDAQGWWEVYADGYLVVHACRQVSDDPKRVMFLFSMYSAGRYGSTLAILPPGCNQIQLSYDNLLSSSGLPLSKDNNAMKITAIIGLDTVDVDWESVRIPNCLIMVTQPKVSPADSGILIRSRRVNDMLSKQLPHRFVSFKVAEWRGYQERPKSDLRACPILLKSGTSIALQDAPCEIGRQVLRTDEKLDEEWSSTTDSLRSFHTQSKLVVQNPSLQDVNEIELDDDGDSLSETGDTNPERGDSSRPDLLVLGSGCATPSAIRGASAHVVEFPADATSSGGIYLMDCGEGTTTMLLRWGKKNWQQRLRGVWISHGHLDHYGGLPTLLRYVKCCREADSLNDVDIRKGDLIRESKRQKRISECCWVIAPPKVLRYLDLCLNCRHGCCKSTGFQIFEPRLHHDPTIPPGPWGYFQNIQVQHNCYPSYALLIGWPQKSSLGEHQMHWFCFSGDTRPSQSLVRACQNITRRRGETLFLLHEATFEDSERDQAKQKKHSTVSEAIAVAKDVGATRLLLTHFSQRYVSLQNIQKEFSGLSFPVGLAMDGLRFGL